MNTDFQYTISSLSNTFLEHVAAERGALKRAKRVQEEIRVPSVRRRPKKRQRTSSEESQRRKDLATMDMRPRRRSVDNGPVSRGGSGRQHMSVQRFPRRAKQPIFSLDEDALAERYESAALRHMEEERTQSATPNPKGPSIAIEEADGIDVEEDESEDNEDELVIPVVRPKQRVRDRPLASDCMSLTPFIMDEDVETDSEDRRRRDERRQLDQMRLRALIAADKMDQQRSDLHAHLLARRSSAVCPVGPPGLRLRVDAIIIPIRKGRSIAVTNIHQSREGCFTLHKLQGLMRVSRPPPRLYAPHGQRRVASGLGNKLPVPLGKTFPSMQLPQLSSLRDMTNDTLQGLVHAELERQREAGNLVRILPHSEQQYTTVRSPLGTWRAEHSRAMHAASSIHPLQSRNSRNQVLRPRAIERQNVKITKSNVVPVSRNLLLPGHVSNEAGPIMLQPQGNHAVHQLNRGAPPRPSSMESSLGTLEMPQMSDTVRASQAQLSQWNQRQAADLRSSLQSLVTPDGNQLMPQGILQNLANLNLPKRNHNLLGSSSARRRQDEQPIRIDEIQTQNQKTNSLVDVTGDARQTMNGYQRHTMRNVNAELHQPDLIPVQDNRVMTTTRQDMMQTHAVPQQYMLGSNDAVNVAAQTNAVYQMRVLGSDLGIQQGISSDVYNMVFQEEYRRKYLERQRQMGGD